MATKKAKDNYSGGGVWKEKKTSASPSNSYSSSATDDTAHLRNKKSVKQPSSSSSSSSSTKPVPNYLKPTISSRPDDASKLANKPSSLDRRRSFDSRPRPSPSPSPSPSPVAPLGKHKSVVPSSPTLKPFRSLKINSSSKPIPRRRKPRLPDNIALKAKSNCPPPPPPPTDPDSIDNNVSIEIMDSEHEEAQGVMGYAIDEELDQIESRGMSPSPSPSLTEVPISESCTELSSPSPGGPGEQTPIPQVLEEGSAAIKDDIKDGGGNDQSSQQTQQDLEEEEEEATAAITITSNAATSRAGEEDTEEVDAKSNIMVDKEETEGRQRQSAAAAGGSNAKNNTNTNNNNKDSQQQQAYNDVIEETASKLLEKNKNKNKVSALVGAFETVISLQEPDPTDPLPE